MVEEYLQKLPPAPTTVDKWIYEEVVNNAYIIYDCKEEKAVCTRCGKRFPISKLDNLKHNGPAHCPKCGCAAEYKNNRYGRKNITEYFRTLIFTHRGNTVYGTLTEVTVEFAEFGRPILNRWLSSLYVFSEKECRYFKHYPDWGFGSERWHEVAFINLPTPAKGAWYAPAKFERTEIYYANLENVFLKSCMKYHYDEYLLHNLEMTPYELIRYMDLCLKYPAIELLRKAGYETLVLDYLSAHGNRKAINIRGKNLKAILRLPRRWHKKVRELELNLKNLAAFQTLDEDEKVYITLPMLDDLQRQEHYREEIEQFVSMKAARKYVVEHGEDMFLYKDYLINANRMGMDLCRKKNLFPENLEEAHDHVVEAYREQKDYFDKVAMVQRVEQLKRDFPVYENDKLFIRVAESQEELNLESSSLSHCVKTYGEKMAAGKTNIFFIREKENPDKSYYTLELSNKKTMIQCRGERNCAMTEEVKAFVDEWLETIQKRQKKKKEAA